jgi:segregation and condensation protein B
LEGENPVESQTEEQETERSDDEAPDEDKADRGGEDSYDPTHAVTTSRIIEALLFASGEPVDGSKMAKILGIGTARDVRGHVRSINREYEEREAPYRIEEVAGGYLILTLPEYQPWIAKLRKQHIETKLSAAALETLAIISYKQPILRVDVEAIRGVACGEIIRSLMERGLVRIVGRAQELGRPLLYGTTKKFLEVFGLNSLRDLPQIEDLPQPAETKAEQLEEETLVEPQSAETEAEETVQEESPQDISEYENADEPPSEEPDEPLMEGVDESAVADEDDLTSEENTI